MIDLKRIREQPDLIQKAVRDKGMQVDVDALLAVDQRRRSLETEYNDLRHKQKVAGETIAKAPADQRAALSRELGELKGRLKQIEQERAAVDAELKQLMLLVPQVPDAQAPVGANADGNVEIRRVGELPKFDFQPRDHIELGERLGLFDLERGVKIAGARNYVLTGFGAMLHEAVLRLAWDLVLSREWDDSVDAARKLRFTPLMVPVLVNENLMEGTGFFPLHRDEVYLCERDERCLVGTAEVPVTGFHAQEILPMESLPRLYLARTGCFRREAGAAGKDTRGLYRIHYFEKLEQVIVCRADTEEAVRWHQVLLQNAEDLLAALEMPYRVLDVCTGDMGQSKVRQFDVETWMPSRNAYGETHSASSYHDFQARRLEIRYRDETGRPQVCFTLNSTAVASPRFLIPLIELNQQADGGIRVPAALRPYMGGLELIPARS